MLLKKRIPWSYIIGKIRWEIFWVTCYAIAFGLFHEYLNLSHVTIPLAIPAIIGTIISLLLAFRSNQAYDRWWEARIVWGSIVNDSRTLVRQLYTFINDPSFSIEALHFIEKFAKRQIFWNYSLGQFLRNQPALDNSEHLLDEDDKRFVAHHAHVPNAVLQLHGNDINFAAREGMINPFQQVELDKTITRLCDSMGKCERIKNTVFPTTYSLYIHFALYLFIILLPFGLTEYLGVVQVPLVILISASFLLIEKMAIHLQDPFENKQTDTPVTAIAQNIERDIREMIRDYETAQKLVRGKQTVRSAYYVL